MKKFYKVLIITGVFSFSLTMFGGFLAPPMPPDYTTPTEFTPPETGEIIKLFPMVDMTAFEHFS